MFDPNQFFITTYPLGNEQNVPYSPMSKGRDAWLQKFPQTEPYLASILHGVTSIDKNRGWYLSGSEKMVRRYSAIFHNFDYGFGWRTFISKAAQSYYSTDMGFVGKTVLSNGGLVQINHIDSTYCQLVNPFFSNGDNINIAFTNGSDTKQVGLRYAARDYIRVCSMPSMMEGYNGLGYCAVSRCVEWATIMRAIYDHDKESLLAKAPRGLLLLNGITEAQWNKAMKTRKDTLDDYERHYFGGINILASMTETIDAKLVALSQLPNNFDLKTYTDLLIYGYSMAFAFPPDEFWPLQGSSFGHSKEVETNEMRSTNKGVGNFVIDLQEQLQKFLPDVLQFEFATRDNSNDLVKAKLDKSYIDAAVAMYDKGDGIINKDEARSFLASRGVIPNSWTIPDENITGTDMHPTSRNKLMPHQQETLEKMRIQQVMTSYPNQPIIMLEWPSQKMTTLYDPTVRINHRIAKPNGKFKLTKEIIASAVANLPDYIIDHIQ